MCDLPFPLLPAELNLQIAAALSPSDLAAFRFVNRQSNNLVLYIKHLDDRQAEIEETFRALLLSLSGTDALRTIWTSIQSCEGELTGAFKKKHQKRFDRTVETIGMLLKSQYRDRRANYDDGLWEGLYSRFRLLKTFMSRPIMKIGDWSGPMAAAPPSSAVARGPEGSHSSG